MKTPRGRSQSSLEALEGDLWDAPSEHDSHVTTETYRLRKVPLKDFTVENFRIMIGQGLGLPHLVPLALDVLEKDPWAAGDFYEGDLMLSMLRVSPDFWNEHPKELERLTDIIGAMQKRRDFFDLEVLPAWLKLFGGSAS